MLRSPCNRGKLMRAGLEQTFPDHVDHVYQVFMTLMRTEDAREGMVSYLEKRPPAFKGR